MKMYKIEFVCPMWDIIYVEAESQVKAGTQVRDKLEKRLNWIEIKEITELPSGGK